MGAAELDGCDPRSCKGLVKRDFSLGAGAGLTWRQPEGAPPRAMIENAGNGKSFPRVSGVRIVAYMSHSPVPILPRGGTL